jgi:hypothetical protein
MCGTYPGERSHVLRHAEELGRSLVHGSCVPSEEFFVVFNIGIRIVLFLGFHPGCNVGNVWAVLEGFYLCNALF